MTTYAPYLFSLVLITAPILAGQQVLLFDCGVLSLACAAFYGVGAYVTAVFSVECGLPPWAGFVLAGLFCVFLAVCIGYPFFRFLRGDFLLVATLGLTQASFVTLRSVAPGGISGMGGIPPLHSPLVRFLPESIDSLVLHGVLCAAALTTFAYLRRRRFGKLVVAARLDENVLSVLGFSAVRLRLQVFVLASLFAGMAGAAQAHFIGAVEPRLAGLPQAILFLCGSVLSGRRSVWGTFVGALFLVVVPEVLQRSLLDWSGGAWRVFPLIQMAYAAMIVSVALVLFPRDSRGFRGVVKRS